MSKRYLYASAAGVLFLLSGAASYAFPPSLRLHSASSTEIAAFNAGAGSLTHAINAIESVTGGQVIAIRYEMGNGAGTYSATFARNGNVDHATVNLATNKVAVFDQAQGPVRTFDYKERADAEVTVHSSKVALREAVARAERRSGGVAVSAEIVRHGNGAITTNDIEVVRSGAVGLVMVDTKNGYIVENPSALLNLQ